MEAGQLNLDTANELIESYKQIRAVAVLFASEDKEDKRGSLFEEAAAGFIWALTDSVGGTFDFAMYALENPKGAGSDALAGLGDTANAAWDTITNPKATYEDIQKQIDEFSKLSKEDQARQFGAFLTNFSPNRRLELLAPDGKGHHGGGIDGNGGDNKIEGVGKVDNPLPNLENATIDPKKLTDYALNPEHPVGGNKAKVFESALGYNKSNADDLIKQVKDKLPQSEAIEKGSDKWGQKFQVDMSITGPNGKTATVRTGWIIDEGSDIPRLTSIYVNE